MVEQYMTLSISHKREHYRKDIMKIICVTSSKGETCDVAASDPKIQSNHAIFSILWQKAHMRFFKRQFHGHTRNVFKITFVRISLSGLSPAECYMRTGGANCKRRMDIYSRKLGPPAFHFQRAAT